MKITILKDKPEKQPKVCPKCNGIGYIWEGKGKQVKTCIDCLLSGRLG